MVRVGKKGNFMFFDDYFVPVKLLVTMTWLFCAMIIFPIALPYKHEKMCDMLKKGCIPSRLKFQR